MTSKKKIQPALCLCAKPPTPPPKEYAKGTIPIVQVIRCATTTCGCVIKATLSTREEAVRLWNKHVREKADKAILEAVIIIQAYEARDEFYPPIVAASLTRSYDKASEDYVRLEKVLESIQN